MTEIDGGEHTESEIVDSTRLSHPLVSHHLWVLRDRRVLYARRQGPFIYYNVRDKRLLDALGVFLQL